MYGLDGNYSAKSQDSFVHVRGQVKCLFSYNDTNVLVAHSQCLDLGAEKKRKPLHNTCETIALW